MAASIQLLRRLYTDPNLSDGDVINRAAAELGFDPVDIANEVGFDGGPSTRTRERTSASVDSFQANLYDVGAGAARQVGLPGVADWADQQRRDNTFQADIAQQRATKLGAVNSFADIRGLSDFGNWAEGVAIGTAPQLAGMAGGALAGGLTAGPPGAFAGALAVGYPSAMGSILEGQRDQTRSLERPDGSVDLLSAGLLAAPYALVDTATGVAGKLFGRGLRTAEKAVTGPGPGMFSRMGREGLKTAGEETAGEVLQTGLEQYGRMVVDPAATMFSPDAMGRYGEAAAGGAFLGGVIGGASGIRGPKQPNVPGVQPQPTEPAGDPLRLGLSGPSGYITFPDGSTATGTDDELMHRYGLNAEQLANLRGGFDYMGAPGVRMDPDAAVPGTPPPGTQPPPTQTPEQRAIEDAAKEFERRTQAAHQTFTDMGPDGATPTIRLKQPEVALHHNLMELQAAGVITPEQFASYAGAVKAGLRAGDKSAVNAVRKEVGRLTKEWEATKNAPKGVQVSDPRVQSAMKGAPRRAQEMGARLFQLVDDGKVPEDDIVDYVNDLVSRRPDYSAVETFIQEAGDVEPGSARTASVAGGPATVPGAVAPRSLGDMGRMAAGGGGRGSAATGAPVAGGAKTVAVGDGKTGGAAPAVTPASAEKFLAGFRGLPDRTRDVVKRWLGVDDNLEALDEPEALDSIGKTLTNEKTGAVGVSRQAVHKEIRAFLKSVGMPENLTPDMVRARFKIEVSDLADIGRFTDSAKGTKATSVTARDDEAAGNSDDAAFSGAADERDTRDEEGNVAKDDTDAAPEADTEDDTEGGERPDDEVDRQRSFADSVEQLLEQDIKLGRVIPTDIAEAAEEWDSDAPSGVKSWAELEPVAQAAWVRNYAYTNGNPSAKTQESLNAQDNEAKQRAPKPDAADAEGPGRPAAVAPTQERNAAGDKRGGQQVQSPVAAAPAKPAAPVTPPAKPAPAPTKPAVKVGTVTRVKKGDTPAKTKAKPAEPEVAPVLTPKEQWDALATATPGMPAWGDLTAKQQDLATDLAHRDQFNLAAAQRIAGDTAVKSDQDGDPLDDDPGVIAPSDELEEVDHPDYFRERGAKSALRNYISLGISHVMGWVDVLVVAPRFTAAGERVADGWVSGIRDSAGRPEMLVAFRRGMDEALSRFVTAHEFGHVADMTPYGGVYSAHPAINPGGAVWKETLALHDADTDFWGAVLEYPHAIASKDEAPGELFAQLMAIYTDPNARARLQKDAPATFNFMETAVNDIRIQKAPTKHYHQELATRRTAFFAAVSVRQSGKPGTGNAAQVRGQGRSGAGQTQADRGVAPVSKGYGGVASQMSGVRRQNYKMAVAMERKGKTAEAIRMATSWFRGLYDKQWRFEFDDSGARWKVDFATGVPESKSFTKPTYVKLGDILEHKRLFKLYPKAKDINIVKREGVFDFFKGLQGWSLDNEIGITPYATDPMSTLLHEVQHWIQAQEGFAPGGNENSVLEALTDKQREKAAKQVLDKLETAQEARAVKRQALVKIAPYADRIVEYRGAEAASTSTYKQWKDTDPALTDLAKVLKDSWMAHHDAAMQLKYALWKDIFGTSDWFRISNEEKTAWISVAGLAGADSVADITAKLDKEIVEAQQKIAALKSGDPEALKKAIKESGQAHGLYRAIAGEIEARDVQARQKMESDERRKTAPFSSEKFDPADVVVTGGKQVSPSVESGPVSVSRMKTVRGFDRWLKKIEANAEKDTAPKLVRDLRDAGLNELPKFLSRKDVRELSGLLVTDLNSPVFDPDYWRKVMAGDNTFMMEAGDMAMGRVTMRQAIGPRDLFDFKISDALAQELELFDLTANSLLNKYKAEHFNATAPEPPSTEGLPIWHDERLKDARFARENARFEELLQSYNGHARAMHAAFAEEYGFDPGPFYDSSLEYRNPPPFEPMYEGDEDPHPEDRDPARVAKERLWAVINAVAGAEAMGIKTGAQWDLQRAVAGVADDAQKASDRRRGDDAPGVSASRGGARAAAAVDDLATKSPFPNSVVQQPVYHATRKQFDAGDMRPGDIGIHFGTAEQAADRGGLRDEEDVFRKGPKTHKDDVIFFGGVKANVAANNPEMTSFGRRRMLKAYIDIRNPLRLYDVMSWEIPAQVVDALDEAGVPSSEATAAVFDEALEKHGTTHFSRGTKMGDALFNAIVQDIKNAGYDGIVYTNNAEGSGYQKLFGGEHAGKDSYIVFDKSQISAPVYDIKYSKGATRAAAAVDDLASAGDSWVKGAWTSKDGSLSYSRVGKFGPVANAGIDFTGTPDSLQMRVFDLDVLDKNAFADAQVETFVLSLRDDGAAEIHAQGVGRRSGRDVLTKYASSLTQTTGASGQKYAKFVPGSFGTKELRQALRALRDEAQTDPRFAAVDRIVIDRDTGATAGSGERFVPMRRAASFSRGGARAAAAMGALGQAQTTAGRVSASMPVPARNAFTDIRNTFKKLTPWLLTNLQLAKEFGKEIPTLLRYVGLGDLMRQKRTSTQMEFNAVAVDWDKLPRAVKTQLHALMQAATMQEMHPDLPFEHKDNAHLKRKDQAEESALRAQHAKLAAEYRQLKVRSPEAVGVYQRAKALLEKSWKERAEAYKVLVADTYGESMVAAADKGDAERLEKLRRQAEAAEKDYESQLAKIKGPYFPLMRFGGYLAIGKSAEYQAAKDEVDTLEGEPRKKAQARLDVLTRDPKHYVVSAHELRSAAETAAARYSAQGLDATTQMGELRLESVRPATRDTITHLTEAVSSKVGAKEGDAVRDALTEVFLKGLPEMHALRREAERKGVTGADTDMLRAFSAAGQSNAFYAARLVYAKDMADTLLNMKKEVKGSVDLQHVYREMQQRMALDMQFTQTPIQDFATSMSWVYHLGLSPSFVLMNATQPWLVSVPVLSGKFGVSRATSAMARASRDALAVLRDARWKDGKWDWWSGISEGSIPGPSRNEDRAAIRKLLQRGIVDEGIQHELSMFSSDSSRWMSKVNRVMGWTTQQVEVANRLATALAAFRLARQNGMTEDAATEYAYDVTHTTQLDYSSDSTARFMRTGGGVPGAKLIFQFRRYQQGINYLLVLNARKAFGDGQEAAQARATLGYLALASGASAGILGLPYVGVAMFLANLLIPDDDEDGDAETRLRNILAQMTGDKDVATALAKGLPTLWGWDLSKRIGMGDIAGIFPMAKYDQAKTGRDKVSETLFSAAGPAAGTAAQILDGAMTFAGGDFVKGTEKMIPKVGADIIKAARYETDGMSTGTGETILDPDEISAWAALTRSMGISSTKESNYYDGTRAMQSVKTAVEDRKSKIANRFRAAVSRGEDLADVRESIQKFNAEHPQHRIQPKDEVQWRRDAQKSRRQRDESGIRVNPTRDRGYDSVMEFAR